MFIFIMSISFFWFDEVVIVSIWVVLVLIIVNMSVFIKLSSSFKIRNFVIWFFMDNWLSFSYSSVVYLTFIVWDDVMTIEILDNSSLWLDPCFNYSIWWRCDISLSSPILWLFLVLSMSISILVLVIPMLSGVWFWVPVFFSFTVISVPLYSPHRSQSSISLVVISASATSWSHFYLF